MFAHTDHKKTPWHVVNADDKKRARLNCIRHLLDQSLSGHDASRDRASFLCANQILAISEPRSRANVSYPSSIDQAPLYAALCRASLLARSVGMSCRLLRCMSLFVGTFRTCRRSRYMSAIGG